MKKSIRDGLIGDRNGSRSTSTVRGTRRFSSGRHTPCRRGATLGLVILLLVIALLPLAATGQIEIDSAVPEAVVVNMADTHSAYDAYPVLITAAEELAASYPATTELVFLFNGDLFELGVAVASRSAGAADWEFLRRLTTLGTVVINIGNHEFDFMTPDEFVTSAERVGAVVIGTVGTTEDPNLVPAYTDIVVGPAPVRIVGIGTDQLNTYPTPLRESLSIPSPIEWIDNEWRNMRAGTDYVVLASHAGLVADMTILESIGNDSRLLFAVGGHDHIVLREEVGSTTYIHTGFRGERFNVAELFYTPMGMQVRYRDVITAEVADADPALTEMIATLREEHLTAEDQAVVGVVPEEMTVLEAAMWSVEQVRDYTGADAAFLNHTSFGSGLPAGPLPRYRFDQFMRFDNDVMRATVDAETMRTILAHANQHESSQLSQRSGDFLYTGGLTVRDGREYEIVTSSWVALDFNQMRYLGTTLEFEQIPDITTKGILTARMGQ